MSNKMNIISNIFDNVILNDNVALSCANTKISYGELQNRIVYTSSVFREHGIRKNDVAAILLPRGIDFVVTLMSLFYLGATALPLDENTPKERLSLILANAKHIIANEYVGFSHINFPIYGKSGLSFEPENIDAHDIAYVVYTSGSTGTPKKIDISYSALFKYCNNLNSCIGVNSSDIYAFTASIGFSSMFRQIFIPLINGAHLLIITDEERTDPVLFIKSASKATIIDLIPSFYDSLCIYLERKDLARILRESSIRLSLSASEPLKTETLKRFIKNLPQSKFINMYGLTETCGIITTFAVDNNYIEQATEYYVPIGKPIPETIIKILDDLELTNKNSGDLLVSSRIISHSVNLNGRYYNTGDSVRLDKDENLIYISRNDRQIKISGKRINLAEIDKNIESHPIVEKSVSIFDETIKMIVTYVKVNNVTDNLDKILRDHAKDTLIPAMVPSAFHTLDEFPLTPSRKLDYRQLTTLYKNMAQESLKLDNESASWNKWEKLIYDAFSDELQKYDLKATDNLFDIGADSLKMAIAMARVTNELGIDIRLNEVIANPTIKELAILINKQTESILT